MEPMGIDSLLFRKSSKVQRFSFFFLKKGLSSIWLFTTVKRGDCAKVGTTKLLLNYLSNGNIWCYIVFYSLFFRAVYSHIESAGVNGMSSP